MGDQRRQNLTTASLQVFVHTNRFRIQDAQHFATQAVQLPVATADTGKLTSAALRGVAAIWKQGYRYNKAGVIFLDLRPGTEVQGTLFDQPDTPAKKRLMRTLDSLNTRYGRDTVTFAASGRRRAWKLRSDQLSARYTTDRDELLSVRFATGSMIVGSSSPNPVRLSRGETRCSRSFSSAAGFSASGPNEPSSHASKSCASSSTGIRS